MAQEVSVGVVVLTEVPQLGRVALLQRRGEWNTEKMKPESYPGAYQVTAHGKAEKGESPEEARNRELGEELGESARDYILGILFRGEFKELERLDTPEKLVITWGAFVPNSNYFLSIIRLGPDSGGLRLLRREEVASIVDLRTFDKTTGVTDRKIIAMFPDKKVAIEKAFAAFA